MKKIIISCLLVFIAGFGFAQSTKTKSKTKSTAKAPAKTVVKKPAVIKEEDPLPNETPEQKAAREKMAIEKGRALTQNMDKNLHFTPAQYEEVLKINQRSINQVEYAKLRYIKKLKKMDSEIQLISNSRLSFLKNVLSPEQFQKYNQKREEKMGIQGEGNQPNNPQKIKETYDN